MDPETAQQRFYDALWPHLDAVMRTAQILCGGNVAEAEDLAQETMLKAFRSIDQYRDGTGARAWLLTILRNARVDRLRAAAATAGTVSLDALAQDPQDRAAAPQELDRDVVADDPQSVMEQFTDRQVIEALGRLPEEIRWTLLLVDVEGWDHQDAAGALGVPVGTIKSRAHRGRLMLRDALLPLARQERILRE